MDESRRFIIMGFKISNRDTSFCMIVFAVLLATFFFSTHLVAQDIHEQFPEHYPDSFDGKGTINRIVSEEVVISDKQFRFHAEVTFHTPDLRQCSQYNFEKDDYVGYKLNDDDYIISMWLLNEFYED